MSMSARSSARMSRRDMKSTSGRFARPLQRNAVIKSIQLNREETYAFQYFKDPSHSGELNTQPPEEKLEVLKNDVDLMLKIEDKLANLIDQKALSYIIYGENSVEACRAHIALGKLYNEMHRPVSAYRHLDKAQTFLAPEGKESLVEPEELIELHVETAEACLAHRNDNKTATKGYMDSAEAYFGKVKDKEIDDPQLKYKRDLIHARLLAAKGKYEDALAQYKKALDSLRDVTGDEEDYRTAKLYAEIGETAEAGKSPEAVDYYRLAYSTFDKLGMEESAKIFKPKI